MSAAPVEVLTLDYEHDANARVDANAASFAQRACQLSMRPGTASVDAIALYVITAGLDCT